MDSRNYYTTAAGVCKPPAASNCYFTVTTQVALASKQVAVMVAVPFFFAVTLPAAETFATFSDFGLPAAAGYDVALRSVFDDERIVSREYVRVNVPAHDCRVYIAELKRR